MHMENGTLCLTLEEQEALNWAGETDPARREFYAKIPVRIVGAAPSDPPPLQRAMAYAKVGITALIDEATGKQNDREPDFLAKKQKEYLNGIS